MAEPGRAPGRMQGYAGTWPPRSAAAAGGLAPSGLRAWSSFTAKLREWAAAEAGAGRLFPWVPVAFGVGIAVYFAADHEPVLPVSDGCRGSVWLPWHCCRGGRSCFPPPS